MEELFLRERRCKKYEEVASGYEVLREVKVLNQVDRVNNILYHVNTIYSKCKHWLIHYSEWLWLGSKMFDLRLRLW